MYEYNARLVKVHDGDTCTLDIDLGFSFWHLKQSVRLFGINAPELATPEGKTARQYASDYFGALDTLVVIRTLKDAHEKYGRWLVKIWRADSVTGPSLNDLLVSSGNAVVYLP